MDTVSSGAATASSSDDRGLALGGYLLLLAAPFTGGATALAAMALAYARRPFAERLARSHYVFQIRTFWTSIFFIAVSVAASLFALFVLFGDVAAAVGDQHGLFDYFVASGSAAFKFHPVGILALLIAVVSWLVGAGWVGYWSLFGLIRLIGDQPPRR
ncbi:MAG TPA: hypothetical protein VG407_09580 [Caulobacteraceae bacterium]|jgi:uncharacterized membrane protein|nr:hypothetical protein [Caulobacteraceae bacterium]